MSIKYVEYLQGDGTSYINTIKLPGGTYNIEMKYNDDTVSTTAQNRLISLTNNSFYYQINQYGVRQVKDSNRDNEQYVDKIVNNVLTDTFTIGDNTSTLRIFYSLTVAQIYYIKLYDTSNNLLYHFRGALDNNNTPCLHEAVNDVIYYNNGVGTFSYGRFIDALYLFANNNNATAENLGSYRLYNMKIDGDLEGVENGIHYVDCLIGDGASYIDTGIMATYDMTFYADYTVENHSQVAFGCSTIRGYGIYQSANRVTYGGDTNISGYSLKTYGHRYQNTLTPTGYTLTCVDENITVSGNYTHTPNGTAKYSVRLFGTARDVDGHMSLYKIKFYEFKIYRGNELVQHLKPCLDTEGIPCMYDEVSKQYFYNQGSGTFGYKKKLRDFQPVLDSNGVPCLMDKVNKKYYYDKNGKGFGCDGYSGVSYLKGDYNSYIDTGLIANEMHGYKIEIKFKRVTTYSIGNQLVFGSSNGGFDNASTNAHLRYNYYAYPQGLSFLDEDMTAMYNPSVDTILDIDFTINTPTSNVSFYLFTGNNQDTPLGTCDATIYYWKVYDTNNNLIQHLIPAIDTDGSIGMYDLVTETFHYNQGTGTFSYGIEESECPKADYVEYLQGNGNWDGFDMGIAFDDTWSDLELKIKLTTASNGYLLLDNNNNVGLRLRNNYGRLSLEYKVDGTLYNISHGNYDIKSGYVTIKITPTKVIFTDDIYGITEYTLTEGSRSGTVNFDIFSYSSDVEYLYYCKVWDKDGNLIKYFQPSLDEENVACVYDIASNEFIYSVTKYNHGKSIGYTPIKYIETNGTQYIDTGVVVNDNTYMDIDYRAVAKEYTPVEYLQGDGASYIDTGIPITTGYDIECNYRHGIPTMTGGIFGLADKNNISSSNHPKFRISYIPETNFNYDNNCITAGFDTTWTEKGAIFSDCTFSNTNYNYYLFGTHALNGDPGTPCHMCDCFISMFKIWDAEGNLVQHLISVLDNEGTPCMYDLVNEQFHYNQGTGTFSYGDVSPSKNYLMNDFYTDTTYKYKEIDTTVEPNLTASTGATLTLGSTYIAHLTESEIEQAIKNGWIIQ